jgi:hypothetical protein
MVQGAVRGSETDLAEALCELLPLESRSQLQALQALVQEHLRRGKGQLDLLLAVLAQGHGCALALSPSYSTAWTVALWDALEIPDVPSFAHEWHRWAASTPSGSLPWQGAWPRCCCTPLIGPLRFSSVCRNLWQGLTVPRWPAWRSDCCCSRVTLWGPSGATSARLRCRGGTGKRTMDRVCGAWSSGPPHHCVQALACVPGPFGRHTAPPAGAPGLGGGGAVCSLGTAARAPPRHPLCPRRLPRQHRPGLGCRRGGRPALGCRL